MAGDAGIFLTFNGNCQWAFERYQACFGGDLQFDFFEEKIDGLQKNVVIKSMLNTKGIRLIGSDLGHNEGYSSGNTMAIFMPCASAERRLQIVHSLGAKILRQAEADNSTKMWEVIDAFGVRWVFSL